VSKHSSSSTYPSRRRLLKLAAGAATLALMNTESSAQNPSILTRPIPRSGELLPAVGVGTWQTFDVGPKAPERAELSEVLRLLAQAGGSVIDSSPMYGKSEGVVGDLASGLGLRDKLFYATKVWTSGRDAGIRQMETSFRLMRTQRMDLMQVHNLLDLAVHAKTLKEWKAAGRIRYIGITHYHDGAHDELEKIVKTREWDFVQFNYSMAEPEAERRLLPACADSGTAVLVNRPFSQGHLFPKVKGKPLPGWAADFDCASWAQFFLKYLLGHPAVTCVIPGTSRITHIKDNLQAGMGRLPDAAMRRRMTEYLGSL
jgi:aryl-alcohol dehydrogenase-like predicted oxidoreductase